MRKERKKENHSEYNTFKINEKKIAELHWNKEYDKILK
jgi:hypothetical protein